MLGNFFTVSPPQPKYEVADVLRYFLDDYRQKYNPTFRQQEVIRAILACRTPQMGGVVNQCEECGAVQFVFRSCGDSHCPKCGKFRKAEWVARQEVLVLPIPYFHITFTTDHALNEVIAANPKVMLEALFWAVSQTLKEFGQTYLGGQLGMTLVLHTWGQTLVPHVHLHCIVTGGALSKDGSQFRQSQATYLFDVVQLSARYRDRLCRKIRRLNRQGKLKLVGPAAQVEVEPMVETIQAKKWEVFLKAFEQVEHLYAYLSRYVHQVAISNHRLTAIDRRRKTVTFRYKDNKDGGQEKLMTLEATQFIWRFLWHVLPRGLKRIRHYGLHHSSCRQRLAQARTLLGLAADVPQVEELSLRQWLAELLGEDCLNRCPQCGQQTMFRHSQYEEFGFLQLLIIRLAWLMTPHRQPVPAT